MSEFRGLHNPERHTEMPLGIYGCWHCARNGDPHEDCTPDYPCYCCLVTEAEALRAQVQAVREAVAYAERNYDAPIVTIRAVKIALDGGDA